MSLEVVKKEELLGDQWCSEALQIHVYNKSRCRPVYCSQSIKASQNHRQPQGLVLPPSYMTVGHDTNAPSLTVSHVMNFRVTCRRSPIH